TNGYLMSMADDWLRREQAVFAQTDERGSFERLRAHVIADPGMERPFILFDSTGRWLAGNRLEVPPSLLASETLDRPVDFTLMQDGERLRYRGMISRLASGNLLLVAQNTGDATRFDEILIHALLVGGVLTGVLGLAGAVIAGADAVRRI